MTYSATYSPEDNKIRLSASSRLDKDLYLRVKAAGFIWAPKQGIFVAPMWTPEREDLALELAGEIEDEDTSLVDRAEERAERFEGYRENRTEDAHRAKKAVDAIADGIPFGQPILVGHHSERHARRDAEKIRSGMERAVRMWDTAQYWKSRAAGALRHAKYKELPAVRARRIKGLEADKRSHQRDLDAGELSAKLWKRDVDPEIRKVTHEQAVFISGHDSLYDSRKYPLADYPRNPPASQYEGDMSLYSALTGGIINAEQAREFALIRCASKIARAQRWLDHLNNRLEYERAMMGETPADKWDFEVGGRALVGSEWLVILKVNKSNGLVNSLTTNARFVSVIGIENVKDYQKPTVEDAKKVKAATKMPPICNYAGPDYLHLTKAEWEANPCLKWTDFPKYRLHKATDTAGAHRVRYVRKPGGEYWDSVPVFLTDQKVVEAPGLGPKIALPARIIDTKAAVRTPMPEDIEGLRDCMFNHYDSGKIMRTVYKWDCDVERIAAEGFAQFKDSLKAGVQVVSAPQLFPTPLSLARRMVELAELKTGQRVLEPSAGTGRIMQAIQDATGGSVIRTAVELNYNLVDTLRHRFEGAHVYQRDFLEYDNGIGEFDAVIMNPPFGNAADILHIRHAVTFLKPGGTLVAICANGPRQQTALKPLADYWEDLPAGTFESVGTGVNTALLVIRKPGQTAPVSTPDELEDDIETTAIEMRAEQMEADETPVLQASANAGPAQYSLF